MEKCILIVGAEGCGKTLLLRRLKEITKVESSGKFEFSPESTIPTVGVDLVTLDLCQGQSIRVREVGASMASRWDSYIPESNVIVFVVDVSDLGMLSSAQILMGEVLCHCESKGKPFAVALNKMELADETNMNLIVNVLRIHELSQMHPFMVILEGSAIDGSLPTSLLYWLRALEAQ